MKERLRDPIWQSIAVWISIVAILVAVLLHLDSQYKLGLLDLWWGWCLLLILVSPPVVVAIGLIIPIPAVSGWVRGRVETLLSAVRTFLRSPWGRRVVAFLLLLNLVVLEYTRSQILLSLHILNLLAFIIQIYSLLALVLQLQDSKRKSSPYWRFIVYATKEEGIDTGLDLQAGQKLKITADGEVSINAGRMWMQPSGRITQGGETGKLRFGSNTHFGERNEEGILGALIGWIGEDRYDSSFFVGGRREVMICETGRLHLGINDTRGTYDDNTDTDGAPTFFTVEVEVLG